jgi:hypothetical protein
VREGRAPSSEQEARYSPVSSMEISFTAAEWFEYFLIWLPVKSNRYTMPVLVPSVCTCKINNKLKLYFQNKMLKNEIKFEELKKNK